MEKEKNGFAVIGQFIMYLVITFFLTLYEVFVIVKIINWYHIPLQLSYKQWFGIDFIVAILIIRSKDLKQKSTTKDAITDFIIIAVFLSIVLGVSYMYSIFI